MDVEQRYREDLEQGSDAFLAYLINTKYLNNLNIIRADAVENDLKYQGKNDCISKYQQSHRALEFECFEQQENKISSLARIYSEYQESQKTRKFSVDFDAANVEPTVKDISEEEIIREESPDTDGLTELKRRLLGKRPSGEHDAEKSAEKQIEDQDNLQNDLVQDMTKLVGSLKRGASAFQSALEEDKFVLDAAEIGVQVASRSLTNVSGKLKKYDKKKLGYLFYILTTIFMILGLLVTFIIIKLFPAL